ncbi:MAG TPA: hypothetical protein VHB46_19750 [Burkholderiales bacterium]|nr:hypothetical protein [Burkholderiales bacterium]
MASPTRVDESSFDGYVSGHDTVVVGFTEDAASAGHFARLASDAAQRSGVAFAEVTSSNRGLFDMFGLNGTALAIFRQRIVLYLESGLPETDGLARLLDRIAAVDLAQAKREIEEERAAREALAVRRVCPTARRGNLP